MGMCASVLNHLCLSQATQAMQNGPPISGQQHKGKNVWKQQPGQFQLVLSFLRQSIAGDVNMDASPFSNGLIAYTVSSS